MLNGTMNTAVLHAGWLEKSMDGLMCGIEKNRKITSAASLIKSERRYQKCDDNTKLAE